RSFRDRHQIGRAVLVDVGHDETARRKVVRQPLRRFGEMALAVSQVYEDAGEMDAEGHVLMAVFVEISNNETSVVERVRNGGRPTLPVPLAISEVDGRQSLAAAAL